MTTKLRLPDVTLVAADNVAHDLTRLALEETLKRIEPGEVIVFSDKKILGRGEWHLLDPTASIGIWDHCVWYEIPMVIPTSHFLVIQYDSWVIDETQWDPKWLTYDYIGAPWWWPENNVGNGGFSMRSRRLGDFLVKHQDEYPLQTPEDDLLCRTYRGTLERRGFKWPDMMTAARFSRERIQVLTPDNQPYKTFGFHGMFRWPEVLTGAEIEERMAYATDYVKKHSHALEMRLLLDQHNARNRNDDNLPAH